MDLPREFRPLFRTSPVLDLIGPLYCRGEGADLVIGLRVEAKHCNARGTVHGGILATLADVALGYTMGFSSTASSMQTLRPDRGARKDGLRPRNGISIL